MSLPVQIMNLEDYADILEHELESAVEVKDKHSLHRAVRLIAENTVGRREYDSGIGELKSDVRLIAERMDERMETMQTQMDQRFEALQVHAAIIDPSPCQLCINGPAV